MARQSILQVHLLLLRIKLVLFSVLGRKCERERLRKMVSFGELPPGNQHSEAEWCYLADLYWTYVFCALFFLCAILLWAVDAILKDALTGEERTVPTFWRNRALLSFTKTPWNYFFLSLSCMQNAVLWAWSLQECPFFSLP